MYDDAVAYLVNSVTLIDYLSGIATTPRQAHP